MKQKYQVVAVPNAQISQPDTTRQLVTGEDWDSSFFRWLESGRVLLNRPQLDAVRHEKGPCLIMAGAGSGKTICLAARTAYLVIVRQVPPERILALTFTKKAAQELQSRVELLTSNHAKVTVPLVGTFHSVFLKLLRANGYRDFKIISNDQARHHVLGVALRNAGIKRSQRELSGLLARISLAQNNLINPEEADTDFRAEFLAYERFKARSKLIDFDGILKEVNDLFVAAPSVLDHLRRQFEHIMIDEYQDVNRAQDVAIKLMAAPSNNLLVCGDDYQTIYSFRGSDVKQIIEFDRVYQEAKVIVLETNYRSNSEVVGLADAVIRQNRMQRIKDISVTRSGHCTIEFLRAETPETEATAILDKILELGPPYSRFAVLYRSSTASRALVERIAMANIPYTVQQSSSSFYELEPVKLVLDHLRLALNSNDHDAFYSILHTLYISKQRFSAHIAANSAMNDDATLLDKLPLLPGLKEYQFEQLAERVELIELVATLPPLTAICQVRNKLDRYLGLTAEEQQSSGTAEMLDSLVDSARGFATVEQFIDHVDGVIVTNQEMQARSKARDFDAVSLMTIHSAKGKEFPIVFIMGLSDGILPHRHALDANLPIGSAATVQQAIEEECRLVYVAITRARDRLFISSPIMYNNQKLEASRFLRQAFVIHGETV